MEASLTTSQALLLNEIGMTAHIPRRVSIPRRDGTLYSRREFGSTTRGSLNSSKLKNQFLSQRRVPTRSLSASQDGPSTVFTLVDAPVNDSPPTNEQPQPQTRSDLIAERNRKTMSLLREIHQKEELRVAEIRNGNDSTTNTPADLFPQPPTQSIDPKNAVTGTEEQETRSITTGIPDQDSAFLFEPLKLGPKTGNLYRRKSLPARQQISSASEPSKTSTETTYAELDGNPISSILELPAGEDLASSRPSYEYGDARFNTLPGESYPIAEHRLKAKTELPDVVTVTDQFFDVNDIEQALKDLVRPDADPRTGLPFQLDES